MLAMANKEEQFILDQRAYTVTIGSGGLALAQPTKQSANMCSLSRLLQLQTIVVV